MESSQAITDKAAIETAVSDIDKLQLIEYLAPVVSSLCAVCVTKLLSTRSLQHSSLLSQALQACRGRVVPTLAKRMFLNDEPMHIGTSKTPISVPGDCLPEEKECLALASGLLATINIHDLPSEDELYLESLIETVVMILFDEAVSMSTSLMFVQGIIHVSLVHCRTVHCILYGVSF